MIAKASRQRVVGRGSFTDLWSYLEIGDDGKPREDCLAAWSAGVAAHETAAMEMERVARNFKGDPVYHAIGSWRPGEHIDEATARNAVDAMLTSLGASEHQHFAALHYDPELDRYHVHVGLNKVHPETSRVLNVWNDYHKLARAAEWCEVEFGLQVDRHANWRKRLGEKDLDLGLDDISAPSLHPGIPTPAADSAAAEIARSMEKAAIAPWKRIHQKRTQPQMSPESDPRKREYSMWLAVMREQLAPSIKAVIAAKDSKWDDFHAAMSVYGVRLEERPSGFLVIGAEVGQSVNLFALGISANELRKRFGTYFAPSWNPVFENRVNLIRDRAKKWTTWAQAHDDLEAVGLAVENCGGSRGKLIDLEGHGSAPLGAAEGLGVSFKKLEQQLGSFEESPALRERHDRDLQRRIRGLEQRAEYVREHCETVLAEIALLSSTWTEKDVQRIVLGKLGLRGEERAQHQELVANTADAVLASCELIDEELRVYTLPELRAEEQAMFDEAKILADDLSAPIVRQPSDDLDAQQQAAYTHLNSGKRLSIVTGAAGAGKSRLLRDLCGAYRDRGNKVLGLAVAGSAARVLGDEAQIKTMNVARFLVRLEQGREQIGQEHVIIVDEASQLGSTQALQLFKAVSSAGATIRLLGDVSQHESVALGAVLRGVGEDHGAFDMRATRRAIHGYLRDVAVALRDGQVAEACTILREHGCVFEFESTELARTAVVRQYADSVLAGRTALLVAPTNNDIDAMNLAAREFLRERLGEERPYQTFYGEIAIAVGEQILSRQGHRDSDSDNGDRFTVLAHMDKGLLLQRQRDGKVIEWDLAENGKIQYGYAVTSYRSQGSTVDDVFCVAAAGRRGAYVDITRARDRVVIAYGRDEISDFGAFMANAQRDVGKTLVRDADRIVARRAITKSLQLEIAEMHHRSETLEAEIARSIRNMSAESRERVDRLLKEAHRKISPDDLRTIDGRHAHALKKVKTLEEAAGIARPFDDLKGPRGPEFRMGL